MQDKDCDPTGLSSVCGVHIPAPGIGGNTISFRTRVATEQWISPIVFILLFRIQAQPKRLG